MSKGKKNKRSHSKGFTPLDKHVRSAKTLVPPLLTYPNLAFANWTYDRLPELLWAALLISHLERNEALAVFRQVANVGFKFRDTIGHAEITHSGISNIEPSIRKAMLETLCSEPNVREVLRPILLLRQLPVRNEWEQALDMSPQDDDWNFLKVAVAKTLFHQSQEATDCRWGRLLFAVLTGGLKLASEEGVMEILEYPDYGDMRKVRPSIRANEGALNALREVNSNWPGLFWQECLAATPCEQYSSGQEQGSFQIVTTVEQMRSVRDQLVAHAKSSLSTTAVDAKHDTVFGVSLYALAILEELLRIGTNTSILGRGGIRILVECYITLSYLAVEDSPDLWKSYRSYGSGQAKLAFLKLDLAGGDVPGYVNLNTLEELASEDVWLEYVEINLGQWGKTDLRKMSERAGVKPEYDKFYGWTSGYVHGHWGCVRDAIYTTCLNPLHRLHRIPRRQTRILNDVIPDAICLTDKILKVVDDLYPHFSARVGTADTNAK